jgi:hypothetical protein
MELFHPDRQQNDLKRTAIVKMTSASAAGRRPFTKDGTHPLSIESQPEPVLLGKSD